MSDEKKPGELTEQEYADARAKMAELLNEPTNGPVPDFFDGHAGVFYRDGQPFARMLTAEDFDEIRRRLAEDCGRLRIEPHQVLVSPRTYRDLQIADDVSIEFAPRYESIRRTLEEVQQRWEAGWSNANYGRLRARLQAAQHALTRESNRVLAVRLARSRELNEAPEQRPSGQREITVVPGAMEVVVSDSVDVRIGYKIRSEPWGFKVP